MEGGCFAIVWVLAIFYSRRLSVSLLIVQTYNLADMARLAGVPGGLVIGAGAGSSKVSGVNCEVSVTLYCNSWKVS